MDPIGIDLANQSRKLKLFPSDCPFSQTGPLLQVDIDAILVPVPPVWPVRSKDPERPRSITCFKEDMAAVTVRVPFYLLVEEKASMIMCISRVKYLYIYTYTCNIRTYFFCTNLIIFHQQVSAPNSNLSGHILERETDLDQLLLHPAARKKYPPWN